jgi:hypothetical protein
MNDDFFQQMTKVGRSCNSPFWTNQKLEDLLSAFFHFNDIMVTPINEYLEQYSPGYRFLKLVCLVNEKIYVDAKHNGGQVIRCVIPIMCISDKLIEWQQNEEKQESCVTCKSCNAPIKVKSSNKQDGLCSECLDTDFIKYSY